MIDYILVNNKYRSSVVDMKVIPGEEIVSQYCLLRESEVKEQFGGRVGNNCKDW